ncbi:BgTH12-01249 [Blumeria graminis f. sp. triticale]|uniref:DNA-directed RNA polymerase III subunit RPC6 n=1 Tax=Blumeria graminis f. sp. triticale TaxID=1689686 RepID=A0A9W4GHM0_BLUGR|nr:BgTH12-01249 [Blumeria graminis f. sp. triticale]
MAMVQSPTDAQISSLRDQLYTACLPIQEEDPRYVFHQHDFMDMENIPLNNDIQTLLLVIQKLLDEKLIKVVHDSEGMGWRIRSQEDAKKYRALTTEQELVYALIDESGQEGIWSKTIKSCTNLHDAVFASCIKSLTVKGYICEMKSVEHPARKMYIKASLRPSDRATGGPWFTDGELDDVFINTALMLLQRHIHARSWQSVKRGAKVPRKKLKGLRPEEIKALRDSQLELQADPPVQFIPMPATYEKYLTLDELTLKIEESSVFNQTLTPSEMQQLLDVLIFDNKIEKVMCGTRWGYRSLKQTIIGEDQRGGVLSEVPCGRCPVFELCEENGPVGPSECVYFNDWLGL